MLEAGAYRYLQQLEGPPAGWWYDRAVPKPLRRSLGRGRVRRFLSQDRTEAERRYLDMERSLQALWSQRETERTAAHQAALQAQHARFLQDLAQRDKLHQQELAALRRDLEAGPRRQPDP